MMAQKDNDVNIEISRATKADSVAMKSIAIVTLTFLPATYVSALLGMNLFNFDPNAHGGHITHSPDLWIYFLSSILLSVAVLAIWWQRREEMIGDLKGTRSKTLSAVP
jgi:Mg2+ and Co2+ transporter CorA